MKNIFKILITLMVFQLNITNLNAQNKVADSTMQKINGFRGFYESLGKTYPPDNTVSVSEETISSVKTYWFNKNLINQKQIIIYLHGGVYTYGSINAYRAMLTHMATALKSSILYIEYSLSPEHPYPTANNEVFGVYKELTKKYPNYKISVIGDSAGGGLAIYLVKDAQKANLPVPASLALISPWIDLKCDNQSYTTKQAVDPILKKDFLFGHAQMYAAGKKEADPSEIRFKKFPPVFLLVGTDEVLNDDSRNFYSYIKPIQKKSKFKEFAGQKHVWLFSHIDSKESVEAMSDIKEFLLANN
ncbi:conserved exported hypothetical protein [Flavobacterium sp. 9AF]|uniref:alpha/beta hydrolase fold domain-containing protein n=1 Tax=Flavobacterium sp. 9AF TaxID=2653142 RepID=UPI0012F0A47C|nr:alpha/beta hydrolase [Flavobacterium sp. 9AF]VXC05412.1 conserved exported hypothetical protein [Flavobacterium sp. 9AF]